MDFAHRLTARSNIRIGRARDLDLNLSKKVRLDVWLHGRGEKNLELQFLHQRQRDLGEYQPADTIVLHSFGRYCNAFKFAGEIDVLEAIEL